MIVNLCGIARGQFAGVINANPPFGFRRPSRFARLPFRDRKGIPKHINQPGAFCGGQAKDFILNGSDAHAANLQLIPAKADSIFGLIQLAFTLALSC